LQRLIEDPMSEKLLNKEFTAGEIIVVDTEEDPESAGERRMTFKAVEGFKSPAAIELAGAGDGTTATPE
jgi:ATP-dependent Clp protease ATP-binding subunit ClpC